MPRRQRQCTFCILLLNPSLLRIHAQKTTGRLFQQKGDELPSQPCRLPYQTQAARNGFYFKLAIARWEKAIERTIPIFLHSSALHCLIWIHTSLDSSKCPWKGLNQALRMVYGPPIGTNIAGDCSSLLRRLVMMKSAISVPSSDALLWLI